MGTEIVTPFLTQLGIGGVGGFVVGYALKKLAKIIVFILGLTFVLLQFLAYRGIIQISYDKLIASADQIAAQIPFGPPTFLISNLPFAGSFVAGFILGIKMG